MPEIICNTSPLQYLHQLNLLDLLPSLYRQLTVPQAVVDELNAGAVRGVHLPRVAELSWVAVARARSHAVLPLASDLGPGESEVLALALERPGAVVIIDDGAGRRCAQLLGIPLMGTIGVLIAARKRGWITALAPVLDQLHGLRFYLSQETRLAALRLVGEK